MKRTVATLALGGFVVLAGAAAAGASELPVNLASPGLVPVTVTDPSASIGGVKPARSGLVEGRVVAHYDKQALIRAGALGPATTQLVASDGSVEPVAPNVTLEVKVTGSKSKVRSVAGAGVLEPLVPDVDLDKLAAKARARTGRVIPDMAAWQTLTLPAGTDADAAIKDLLASGQVSDAYVAPEAAPPPQTQPTPDFTAMQGYLRPAPQGIDADFTRKDPRIRGAGVTIADLEYYWTANHEDLQLDPIATDLGKTTYPQYPNFADEHGTAVFGEMVAKDNGYGVTGGVPDATMRGISPQRARPTGSPQYNTAAALTYVAQFLSPGDVVLIEQQTVGPGGGTKYVPIEWTQANFDAIKLLSDMKVIVMETGGNGGEDLDSAPMLGRFDRTVRDSGAIIGGAGSATTHAALNFSSYGKRVDLQGWGESITTTGSGGNLFGGTAPEMLTRRYTRSFSGTSGAGPIVTSAIAAVQSYLKATGQTPYTSAQMIDLLRRTGTAQTGTRQVGPLPNLAAALKDIEVDGPVTKASLSPAPVEGWYLNPTITLSADDGWGVGVKDGTLEYRLDGGDWKPYTAPFSVLTPNAHTLETRATDLKGNTATRTTTFNVYDLDTPVDGAAGGSVPATLALTLGGAASFGAFVPGVDRVYSASTTANVISSAGDALLTVSDPSAVSPGRLVNGTFALNEPVQATAKAGTYAAVTGAGLSLLTYAGPISNDSVAIGFRQHIGAGDALRTGAYGKTLTFTLSTTTP
ncbi:S8 family serine peptidase [Solirubrobacter ginsenosidimutans]|uniref:S8 family serine peptidase n=1 Tax=Solirubrobacter ginsenosidimutans TaxID=490573 RepID=A0A9X3MQM5_9ACTN|nr:S8 family serine peptidase [Solirubrobacter ginsenosidimutans]MDA0160572.1 S8 family serine peptidase [Solirubrobacter ginsenosidimutans]